MTTLIKNARILTLDEEDREFEGADILIEGATIAAIGEGLRPDQAKLERTIDARGLLAMPGLVNAHYHSSSQLYKGAFEGAPLEIIMLYEDPPLTGELGRQRFAYLRTLLGVIEMLKLGVTAVRDDAYFVPKPTPEAIEGIMQAYEEGGIRAEMTLDVGDQPELERHAFLRDLLPEDLRRRIEREPVASSAELIALYRDLIARWHGACDGRLTAAVSCSAPQRASVPHLEALEELSRRHGLAFNAHILETKAQRVLGQDRYGKSLIRYVHDLGILSDRMVVIHAVWTDPEDLRLMAESGCTVAHNPISNLKLGSGVMPFRRLRDRGIPIALGSDEACADDTANIWGVAKTAGLIQKINGADYLAWPTARELLAAATAGGARAMRREGRGGRLAPGCDADLILLDLNSLAFTPLNDLRRQLVYAENGSSVVLTMVAGRVVMEEGRVTGVDEEAIKAEIRDLTPAHSKVLAALAETAALREPYYRAMYLRSAERDVGFDRWLGGDGQF